MIITSVVSTPQHTEDYYRDKMPRFQYDPKSEIKTQTRSNAIYPKRFFIKKVKRGRDRTEWKEKTEVKQGCRIGLQE